MNKWVMLIIGLVFAALIFEISYLKNGLEETRDQLKETEKALAISEHQYKEYRKDMIEKVDNLNTLYDKRTQNQENQIKITNDLIRTEKRQETINAKPGLVQLMINKSFVEFVNSVQQETSHGR